MSDWPLKTLQDVAISPLAIVDGPFGSNLKTSDYIEDGVPVLQGNNITGDRFEWRDVRFISKEKAAQLARSAVRVGDLLAVKIGSVGYSALLTTLHGYEFGIIPANLIKATFDPNIVDPKFVFYQLTSEIGKRILQDLAGNTAQPALSLKKFRSIKFRYPPLFTQHRITEILSTVDEAIEQTDALIAKIQQVKAGLMHDLFTRGVTPDGRLRPTRDQAPELYKESPLGWIPKEWEVEKLGELCDVTKLAGFEFTNVIRYRDDGEVIALRALNIKNEELDLTDIQRISRQVSDSLPRSKVRAGDVLITYIGAYIGDVLLISENDKYHLAPNVARISPQRNVNGRYLESALRCSFVRNQMSAFTAVTATPSLTMTQIRKFLIPYPTDNSEQEMIEQGISDIAISLKSEKTQLEMLRMQRKGLMRDLLSGNTSVLPQHSN